MISVCIPSYNGEKYIMQQLQSILSQLQNNDEIIISDDGSTDNTIELIKSISDHRIKIFENMNFKNPVYNLENALKHAKGDYIFLSDQDDIWVEGKVEIMKKYLSDFDLVISNASIINANGKLITFSYFDWKKSGKGFWKNFYKNTYIGCAMAFNRKILNLALPFPKRIAMHDVWIGLLADANAKVFFLDEKLLLYRRHETNITYSISRNETNLSDNSLWFKLSYRLVLLLNILIRLFRSRKQL